MQMHTLVSHHVVSLAWIDEEVGLCASFGTCVDERQGVLGNNRRVVHTDDNLQFALEVLGHRDERTSLDTLLVGVGSAHVSLAIHHLIPSPVDDRTSSHSHLEHVGIVGHKRYGHKSAIAPSVHTKSVGIDIRQRLEIIHTLHLVEHLHLAELVPCGLLKLQSAVFAATVVEDEDDISLLCHVCLPRAAIPMP